MEQASPGPEPRIEIYTKRFCGYCASAKALLQRKGLNFKEIKLGWDSALRDEMIRRANGRITVPQIFIGPVHVGGCDDLYALERTGELDKLLANDGQSQGQSP